MSGDSSNQRAGALNGSEAAPDTMRIDTSAMPRAKGEGDEEVERTPLSPYQVGRDEAEWRGLDDQQQWFIALCDNAFLSPDIPIENVTSVADVGSNTGTWLLNLSRNVANLPTPDGTPRLYRGFDNSGQQFPGARTMQLHRRSTESDIGFVTQDVLKPFPQKEWSRFDVVTVRFLGPGLRDGVVEEAVGNVVKLLKPGGYVQWSEMNGLLRPKPAHGDVLSAVETAAKGIDLGLPDEIMKCMSDLGLEDVRMIDFKTEDRPGLEDKTNKLIGSGMVVLLKRALMEDGKTEEEAVTEAAALAERNQGYFREGMELHLTVSSVLGKKPA